MSNQTLLRETLIEHEDRFDISPPPVAAIASTARRRTLRSRVGFGAVALTLFAVVFAGIGLSRPSEDRSTLMFAGLDSTSTPDAPMAILATDAGWLGATLVDKEVYLATSTDGESWQLAESTGLSASGSTFALDEHDGRHWLAVYSNDVVQLAFTDDLSEWTLVALPPEANEFERELSDGYKRLVEPAGLVATESGVMLKIDAADQPDFEVITGRELGDVCNMRWSDVRLEIRDCGSSEWEVHDAPPPHFPGIRGGDSNLVFSANGVDFDVYGAAGNDTRLPYSAGQRLYETESGFGLSDYLVRESNDGTTWQTIEQESLGRLTSPSFVAARGPERVATSSVLNSPAAQLLFSADGMEWTSHPIDHIVNTSGETENGERGTQTFNIASVVGGEAGWAVVGSTYTGGQYLPFDDHTIEPFTVSLGDLTVAGQMPGGPAELTDSDGNVVRSWDRFEPRSPWMTGTQDVQVDGLDLIFTDDAGERLASIPTARWNEAIGNSDRSFVHIVLFSEDGKNWTQVAESLDYITGVAVGDDEVVLAIRRQDGVASERIDLDHLME